MTFWRQVKSKIVGILAGLLVGAFVGFGSFAFKLYDTIEHIVPEMGAKVDAMQDTVKTMKVRPAQIERRVGLIEKDIDDINKAIIEINDNAKESDNKQEQYNQRIIDLLFQIKNGR